VLMRRMRLRTLLQHQLLPLLQHQQHSHRSDRPARTL
jgi:hypothetical protein